MKNILIFFCLMVMACNNINASPMPQVWNNDKGWVFENLLFCFDLWCALSELSINQKPFWQAGVLRISKLSILLIFDQYSPEIIHTPWVKTGDISTHYLWLLSSLGLLWTWHLRWLLQPTWWSGHPSCTIEYLGPN